jgi:hypothetical protein
MSSYSADQTLPKWFCTFFQSDTIVSQQVVHSPSYPEADLDRIIGSPVHRVENLFFAENAWVLHSTTRKKLTRNQALRSRPDWDSLRPEIDKLGAEKWRIQSITWGTGDWYESDPLGSSALSFVHWITLLGAFFFDSSLVFLLVLFFFLLFYLLLFFSILFW